MEPKFVNFFKFLEDKEGKKTPLKIKLLHSKQFEITPEDLDVEGNLNLDSTKITSLPNGLKVRGYLSLFDTSITSLPKDLKIRGNLYLSNTKITSLPNGLEVGGNLYLYETPLSSKTETEIRQMAPNIKRKIYGVKS